MAAHPDPVNIEKLRLVLKEVQNNYDEEEYLVDPDKPFLQFVTYDICLEGEAKPVGKMILNIISRENLTMQGASQFWWIMDEHSEDLKCLATDVFTKLGRLRPEVYAPPGFSNRPLPWSAADAQRLRDHPAVYIEQIVINEAWRHRGIGSWAIQKIFETDLIRPLGVEYLMVWPTILNTLEPMGVNGPFGEYTEGEMKAREAKRERIVWFYRKLGFRRLGVTEFFMLAKDPEHPSRRLRYEDELPHVATRRSGPTM